MLLADCYNTGDKSYSKVGHISSDGTVIGYSFHANSAFCDTSKEAVALAESWYTVETTADIDLSNYDGYDSEKVYEFSYGCGYNSNYTPIRYVPAFSYKYSK